ncbi:hypothetical protein D3C71_2140740 [compost metagenome]
MSRIEQQVFRVWRPVTAHEHITAIFQQRGVEYGLSYIQLFISLIPIAAEIPNALIIQMLIALALQITAAK